MSYAFIYKLRPHHEDLRRGGKGWYKLQWRPIKHKDHNSSGNWNLYIENTNQWGSNMYTHLLGFRFYSTGAHGWGRTYKGIQVEIGLIWCKIHFWVLWDILCMAEGPSDVADKDKKPLDLSRLIRKSK